MQGIFIHNRRPKSKKEVKAAIASGLPVYLEATSLAGNEYGGPVADAPPGRYHFVGPDPHTARRFYGTLTIRDGQVKVA